MLHTMRWFGTSDPVSLMDIRQAGCVGVVTALHQIPVGEIWSVEAINERKNLIEAGNNTYVPLKWLVVESLPVHEDIKKGLPTRDGLLENYKKSLKNLALCGIKTVCYNFMPVLDWTRTDLSFEMRDGSRALRFVWEDFAIFDLFILKRPNASADYSIEVQQSAKKKFDSMSDEEIERLKQTALLGLPGSDEAFELNAFQALLDSYQHISEAALRENLYYFIQHVAPAAEKLGVNLCIHPDDPPYPLLGLPRIVSTESDLSALMNACDSPSNGITFCTGSLGVRADNNIPQMIRRFANRIHFIHLRTTQRELTDSNNKTLIFHEAPHLAGDVNMVETITEILKIEQKRQIALPMRPDHGHQMMDDLKKKTYPGYSAIGRMKGLAELRGVETALSSGALSGQR